MPAPFDCFVIFAEMRTGSNFLEDNLNAFDGITSHGELFNPHFVGRLNRAEHLGIDMRARDAAPLRLIERIRAEPGLNGFRFFHDHDPRVLAHVLRDRRCAKIVLTRNPLDSYVSRKIAAATGQWKLTNEKNLRQAQVRFDPAEFAGHLERLQAFQLELLHALQTTGQTAFYIGYDDLHDVAVLNGLAEFLGVEARLSTLSSKLKKQNPEPVQEKVENPGEMAAALAALDRFDLSRTPNFEPRRGPTVPAFRAGVHTPILFQPVRGAPDAEVLEWMAALDGVDPEAPERKFDHPGLLRWMREHPGHRCFSVLRHPVPRAWWAFDTLILSGRFGRVRDILRRNLRLALPDEGARAGYGPDELRADFLGFLRFLKQNLAGQSSVRVDAAWASQGAQLRGYGMIRMADVLLREEDWAEGLGRMVQGFGRTPPPPPPLAGFPGLAAIYDDEVEAATLAACGPDYTEFGFGPWR